MSLFIIMLKLVFQFEELAVIQFSLRSYLRAWESQYALRPASQKRKPVLNWANICSRT